MLNNIMSIIREDENSLRRKTDMTLKEISCESLVQGLILDLTINQRIY